MKLRSLHYLIPAAFLISSASAQYSTGFENPAFVSGDINGQDSWTTSRNTATARVLTATEISTELTNFGLNPGMPVHGGSQALLVSGSSDSNATIRLISGLLGQNNVVLDVWTRPLTGGSTGNIFLTMEDSEGDRAAAFRFGPTDIDYGTNGAGIWQPSGLMWNADTWYRLTMSVDYAAQTYDFAINGAQINATPIPFYAPNPSNRISTELTQIRIFRGLNQSGMIVDDLIVTIPEPGAMAFWVLGGSVALFRRNRNSSGHSASRRAL